MDPYDLFPRRPFETNTQGRRRGRKIAKYLRRCQRICDQRQAALFACMERAVRQQRPSLKTPSRYDSFGGGRWRIKDDLECDFCVRCHLFTVTYTHNPYDVDIFEWNIDGVSGYVME